MHDFIAISFWLVVIFVLIVIFNYLFKRRYVSKKPWQHFFDNTEFSAMEFYETVTKGVKDRNVNGVNYARKNIVQSHILSERREYLKITRDQYDCYVCAAKFGTGMFVSEWLCTKKPSLISQIPIIGKMLGIDRSDKTFYQIDSEAMYRSVVHTAVLDAVEGITNSKGIRGLTEKEKQLNGGNE